MTYFGGRYVAPQPNADDAPYWENCAQRRLTFQKCAGCDLVTHPPIGVCPRCQSFERVWIDAPAPARVFSFTWIHTAAHDSVAQSLPYNVAVVEFADLPGVRLITNVVDATPGELSIGDPVSLVWEEIPEGMFLPRFRKSESGTTP
jgi:uncharacterized OB-fold protein